MTETWLTIHQVPPSFNAVGYRTHWAVGRKAKQQWQQDLETLLMAQRVPRGLARVEAEANIYFNERRRRDEGNFRVILEKALGDALVNGGWLADDTPDSYTFGTVRLVAPDPNPRTVITLNYKED